MQTKEPEYYHSGIHTPAHLFIPNATYIVTAGTLKRARLFDTPDKLDYLLKTLLQEAARWQWSLHAWAVMPNHYHLILAAPVHPDTLADLIRSVHSRSAAWLNKRDETPGRRVWFNYWDTCLTSDKSYWNRMNYVLNNPVKHRYTDDALAYRWSSMQLFQEQAEPHLRDLILHSNIGQVRIFDSF